MNEQLAIDERPTPITDELSERFWSAAKHRRLVIQRCRACYHAYHPPVAVCLECTGFAFDFVEASGRGRVSSFCVSYDQHVRGFAHRIPYALVWVVLEDFPEVTMVTNFVAAEPDELAIDLEVEVAFEQVSPEIVLPQFRPTR